jgi:hypothetical protein
MASLTLRQIFNDCQDQSSTENKLAKCFWQNAQEQGAWDDVDVILAHTVHLEKVRVYQLESAYDACSCQAYVHP